MKQEVFILVIYLIYFKRPHFTCDLSKCKLSVSEPIHSLQNLCETHSGQHSAVAASSPSFTIMPDKMPSCYPFPPLSYEEFYW